MCPRFNLHIYGERLNIEISKLLSIYAACLSTIVFVWNMQKAIPRYKVDLIAGVTGEDDNLEHGIYVSIKNPSPHIIHLANVQMLYPIRNEGLLEKVKFILKHQRLPKTVGWCHTSLTYYGVNDGCPIALESGKSHAVFVPNKAIEEILEDAIERKVKAVVQDQLSRNKYSKSFDYPIYENEKSANT